MIYLDNAATTKPYPEVVSTITDILQNHWGNASSPYSFGQESKNIIESVREQIAEDINCSPHEIIFTSGGCESNSLAIMGFFNVANRNNDYGFYTSRMEHSSIAKIAEQLKNTTVVRYVDNDNVGVINYNALMNIRYSMEKRKPFISIAAANSEIGTIQNIESICNFIYLHNGIYHCDATALYPYERIDVKKLGIDMMTVSAQKFGATEGVSFLYVKDGIKLQPIIYGSQENYIRGGSYNTALIAGMGKALEITRKSGHRKMKTLTYKLVMALLQIDGVYLNGDAINRLPNNINVTIDGCNAETLVTMADMMGIMISKGSACQSHEPTPSATLKAIGLSDEQAFNTIRITLGENNTEEEIDKAIEILPKLIDRIRNS